MERSPGIGFLLLKAALLGFAGFVAVPVLLFILVIVLGRVFDPRCGTPGDSGGCEMGAAAIALASAVPAFALFFLVGVILAIRRRNRAQTGFTDILDRPPPEDRQQ